MTVVYVKKMTPLTKEQEYWLRVGVPVKPSFIIRRAKPGETSDVIPHLILPTKEREDQTIDIFEAVCGCQYRMLHGGPLILKHCRRGEECELYPL